MTEIEMLTKQTPGALSWNIKHTMWHCGQIVMLKRIIDKPHNFRLSITSK